jgi:hypothetical protein
MANWLDKYEQGGLVLKQKTKDNYGKKPNPNDVTVSTGPNYVGSGYDIQGRDYSPAWGGRFQMGGSIPGAVGFTYARTQSPAPSNGKYAKKTKASAQDGAKLDMHGSPITAIEKHRYDIDRSYYNPRTNQMILGADYAASDNKDKMIAHENYHAKQHSEGRDNFDIGHDTENRQWAEMQKRPQMMSTPEVWNNFYNRKAIESDMAISRITERLPESQFFRDAAGDIIYNKIVDPIQYDIPYSFEGEAQFYENTGKEFKNGGWLNKYDVAQDGVQTWKKQQELLKKEKAGKLKALLENPPVFKKKTFEEKVKENVKEKPRAVVKESTAVKNYNNADKFSKVARNKTDKEIADERKAIRKKSDANVLNQYSTEILKGDNWTRQNLSDAALGLESKFRVSDEPNFFDDYLNPFNMVGNMASNLGQAPLQAEQSDSYLPYITSIGTPLTVGALGGLGASSNAQFVNNLTNPVAGLNVGPRLNNYLMSNNFTNELLSHVRSLGPQSTRSLLNQGGFDLARTTPKYKKKLLPQWTKIQLDNGLIEQTPLREGINKEVVKQVVVPGKGQISLKTNLDDLGNPVYYFSADLAEGGLWAGKAFKHLEQFIPKGAKILENRSLSTDSFYNVIQRAKNPKQFTWVDEGQFIPLNNAGTNRVFSNNNKIVPGSTNVKFEDYNEAVKALNELNSRITIEGMPKAKLSKIVDDFQPVKDGPWIKKTTFGIDVPNVGLIKEYKQGGVIKDDRGQWDHPGEITEINSNDITMEGVPYDVLGISDEGDVQLMKPGKNYKFKGKKVTEFPMAKNGLRQEQKSLQNLDNLTNFTNYNKPQPGGWLNKYN